MIRLEQNGVILFIEGYTENNNNYVYRGESISVYIDASGAAEGSFAGFVVLSVNDTNLGSYLCDSRGCVNFEMNYALRNITPNSLAAITIYDVNAWGIQFNVIVKDGVNIKNVIHPIPTEMMQALGTSVNFGWKDLIIPPNVIYESYSFNRGNERDKISSVLFESNNHSWTRVRGIIQSPIPNPFNTYPDTHEIIDTTDYIFIDNKLAEYKIRLTTLDECEPQIVVRWISQFGNLRQHLFKVKSIKNSIYESTSLITGTNGVKNIKNTDQSVELLVEGLTEYSLWYYSDLLLSKEIHATRDIENSMYAPPQLDILDLPLTLSEVDDKEIEFNPSTKLYDLSIKLKFKQYRNY